ncbi:hypothetical protein BaRGS_00035483 [Batillaria attramentaria]|uniref:AIG1-type G domain-containing protein n=1 Tax=Batillaria attramentaria TaxID=370345 RepID=A0ABD0JES4_9CAEN
MAQNSTPASRPLPTPRPRPGATRRPPNGKQTTSASELSASVNPSPQQMYPSLNTGATPTNYQAQMPKTGSGTQDPASVTLEGGRGVLIIGKTGNGKSTLGNLLLNSNTFRVGKGIAMATAKMQSHCGNAPGGIVLEVIDTPDISNLPLNAEQKKEQVSVWKKMDPRLILLAVRCDVRYTPEEFAIYSEIKRLWGDDASFCGRLIVAFTIGDCLDRPVEQEMAEKTFPTELKNVLSDAGGRYVVFSGKAPQLESAKQRDQLFKMFMGLRISSTTTHSKSMQQHPLQNVRVEQPAPSRSKMSADVIRVLIIGKSGNGKSTLGNILLGEEKFAVGGGMSRTTTTADNKSKDISKDKTLEVIDTQDISNMSLDEKRKKEKISVWRTLSKQTPNAILLAVRCDVRYTPEEFAIYSEIKRLWGDDASFCGRLIVAFTVGDRLDRPVEQEMAEKTFPTELKNVLSDASGRYAVFNAKAPRSDWMHQRDTLLRIVSGAGLLGTPF